MNRGNEMDKQNAIEVRNMSKKFKVYYDRVNTIKDRLVSLRRNKAEYHEVLKDINLNIKKGETVALIGTNGSGKSTLLKLMTKIIFPNEGTVETNGKLTSLLELGAGFHIDFTGRENIYFNASIFGLTRKEIDERIDDIIEFSELGEFIDHPVRTYSSGMYMRLAFSVAINVDAEILLIDEILAVGDQHFQDKCFKKLIELRDSGKTIVIVSHSLDVVKKLCHRAIWIYKGEVRADGDPTYVIDEYLTQVAIDHKEEKSKSSLDGTRVDRAIVYVDTPNDFSEINIEKNNFVFTGWEVSDCPNSSFSIFVDGREKTNIKRISREDVYQIYLEEFSGFIEPNTIGWECLLQPGELGVGTHTLSAQCFDENGKVIADKEITIKIV